MTQPIQNPSGHDNVYKLTLKWNGSRLKVVGMTPQGMPLQEKRQFILGLLRTAIDNNIRYITFSEYQTKNAQVEIWLKSETPYTQLRQAGSSDQT